MMTLLRARHSLGAILPLILFSAGLPAAPVTPDSPAARLGVLTDNFPFSYRNENGEMEGFAYELTREIEKVMGLRFERIEGPTNEINGAFMTGRLGLVQSYAQSPERESYADFSVPYLIMTGAIVVRKGETDISSLGDLKGRKVMVHRGSLGEAILKRHGLDDSVVYVDSVEDALVRLNGGENDATLVTRLSALAVAHRMGLKQIRALDAPVPDYDVRYCLAVSKGNPALLAKINEGLAVLVHTGRFSEIYRKWFSHLEPTKYSEFHIMLVIAAGLALALIIALWAVLRQRRLQHRIIRQAEALRFSEERYRGVFEGAHDGLIVLAGADDNGNFHVEQINPAARKLLDKTEASAERITLRSLLESEPELYTRIAEVSSRRDSSEFEHQIQKITDAGHWRVSVIPFGGLTLVTLADITEAAQSREKLRVQEAHINHMQKLEAIGTLAGGVAHDFNNLLTVILGNTELGLMGMTPAQPESGNLQRVLQAAQRARQLVKQILMFSRRSEPSREELAVSPLIEETAHFLRSVVSPDIAIEYQPASAPSRIVADSAQLHQVLMNIGTNAIQAMRDEPGPGLLTITEETVHVRADEHAEMVSVKPGHYVRIGMQDTGPGIPPDVIKRMFEPFFTTKPVGEGTGLGLSVVHGIMQQHGGAVTVYSQPGRGTLFHLYFPVASDELSNDHASDRRSVTPGAGEWILLVDDDAAVVGTTQQILTRLGYQVSAWTDPKLALSEFMIRETTFAVVVSDLTMPGMNGLQLVALIRARRPEIPCILTSGFFSHAEVKESDAIHISTRLCKPLTYASLGRAVAACLKRNTSVPFDDRR